MVKILEVNGRDALVLYVDYNMVRPNERKHFDDLVEQLKEKFGCSVILVDKNVVDIGIIKKV